MNSEPQYFLERGRREIIAKISLSRRPLGLISEEEVEQLVQVANVRFFVHSEREQLHEVSSEEVHERWRDDWLGHIAANDDAQSTDFVNGYFYFAERWKGYGGQPIVVLHYHH